MAVPRSRWAISTTSPGRARRGCSRRSRGVGDPRIGRGFYPTFNAKYPLLRWPLDHMFVTPALRTRDVGSTGWAKRARTISRSTIKLCLTDHAAKREGCARRGVAPRQRPRPARKCREGKTETREEDASEWQRSMAAKVRADQMLVARGLAESRTRAQALIMAGHVFVGDASRQGRRMLAEDAGFGQGPRPSVGVARRDQARPRA